MSFADHEAGLVVFFSVLLVIAIVNLVGLRRLGSARRGAAGTVETPRVSVLVPARNEERHIADCVRSLLSQDYADYEVLVLDDHSEDGTSRAVRELLRDPHLRLLTGRPLPPGWLGKSWACQQLATEATGKLLLFTDADTRHRPSALRAAVTSLYAQGVDFLSAMPRQEMRSCGERVVVPILPWSQHTFFPIPVLRKMRCPELATAVGQYMLVRREAYDAVGGYECTRASAVDDWDFVRAVAGHGLRWTLCDGAGHVTTRMYSSFRDAADGFSKNLYARFGYNLPIFAFVWSWLLWATWQPPILLLLRAASAASVRDAVVPWAAAATGLSFSLWLISDLRFGVSPVHAVFHPVTVLAVFAIAMRSVVWRVLGRGTWKGRHIGSGRRSALWRRCGR